MTPRHIGVKVVPRASKSEVMGTMEDGTLKVRVAAVPEDGRANDELCRTLARYFGLPAASIQVVAGRTSTRKTVRIG